MNGRQRVLYLLTALALLLPASLALANGTPAIDWHVIGGGGGHAEASPYTLDGTIGQAVVGIASEGNYELCSGFWCGAVVGHKYRIYLPLVVRNHYAH